MVLKLRLILCFRSDLKRLFLPLHLSDPKLRLNRLFLWDRQLPWLLWRRSVLFLRLNPYFLSVLKILFLLLHLSVLSLRWLRLSRLDLFHRWRLLFPDCQLRLKRLFLRLFPAVLYFLSLLFRLWHLSVRQLP